MTTRTDAVHRFLTAVLVLALLVLVLRWARVDTIHVRSRAAAEQLLAVEPDDRLAVGGIPLDGDLATVIAALGPAGDVEPGLFGTAHVWDLGGSRLVVVVWDGSATINGIVATTPAGEDGPAITLFGGLRLGAATIGDVERRWGPPDRRPSSPNDDFLAQYEDCIGPFPIVIKLDAPGTPRGHGGSVEPGRRVTSILVAYADEPPGGPCGEFV